MSRKSQVDKFKRKWGKKEKDLQAIKEAELYRKKEIEGESNNVQGVDDLMSEGNIKEAAVVFSKEGMTTFANMFSNSVENAVIDVLSTRMNDITKNIESKMESIIEAKMLEMLEGMTEGMKQFNATNSIPQDGIKKVLDGLRDSDPNMGSDVRTDLREGNRMLTSFKTSPTAKKEVKSTSTEDTSPLKEDTTDTIILTPSNDSMDKAHELVVKVMSGNGSMKLSEIITKLKDEHNAEFIPTGTTSIMQKLIKRDPNIEKVGYGLYQYREKKFNPTL